MCKYTRNIRLESQRKLYLTVQKRFRYLKGAKEYKWTLSPKADKKSSA